MTLYSTAVRRAELGRLKVQDIDSQRMMIRTNQGKGGRNRAVPLSPKLLETLRVYFRWMRPTTFLFPVTVKGVRADVPITPNGVWLACRQAAQRAGITMERSAATQESITLPVLWRVAIPFRRAHRLASESGKREEGNGGGLSLACEATDAQRRPEEWHKEKSW
jgi:integrase